MEQRKLFRALKEVGAYNAYKRNLASNRVAFNICDVEQYESALEYIADYESFDWLETLEGHKFWFEIYLRLRNLYLKMGYNVD